MFHHISIRLSDSTAKEGEYSENTDDAITGAKIADGTLVTAHYAAGSVDHLDCMRFTPATLTFLPVFYLQSSIPRRSEGGGKNLLWNQADAAALGDDAVTAAKLNTGAVTTDAMAADSVATVSVIDNAITTAKIVDQCRSEKLYPSV